MNPYLVAALSIAGICIVAHLAGPTLRRLEDRLRADLDRLRQDH